MAPTDDGPPPHPDPPDDLGERSLPTIDSSGPWYRLYPVGHEPLHFGTSGRGRFDAPGGDYGVCYAADDAYGAFIETYGRLLDRDFVTRDALNRRGLVEISSGETCTFVDLTAEGLNRLGADNRLATGTYSTSQQWSEALHEHPVRPDGLRYRSRHDPSRICVALFDHLVDRLTLDDRGPLGAERNRRRLADLLAHYEFGLVE